MEPLFAKRIFTISVSLFPMHDTSYQVGKRMMKPGLWSLSAGCPTTVSMIRSVPGLYYFLAAMLIDRKVETPRSRHRAHFLDMYMICRSLESL